MPANRTETLSHDLVVDEMPEFPVLLRSANVPDRPQAHEPADAAEEGEDAGLEAGPRPRAS
jgi:hypothetical protein